MSEPVAATAASLVLVLRPTPAGSDERSAEQIRRALSERTGRRVLVAHLDQGDPSLHEVLDRLRGDAVASVTLVPLTVPDDRYLVSWIGRAVANWRETRSDERDVRITASPSSVPGLTAALAELVDAGTAPITSSPAAFRSPSWSVLEIPERHLFVCRGPRCTAHGAGPAHRAVSEAARRGSSTQVTPTGCLGPCNLGPLVVEHPGGTWHQQVSSDTAARLGAPGPDV